MLNSQRKIIPVGATEEQVQEFVDALPRPLVFTNGCFDLLHRGHTTYLEQARNIGAALIVAVNTDASVKRQGKGDDRPVNIEEDRMAVLASLQCVDAVISFDEDTPFNVIKQVLPNHLVKGGDWKVEDIVGGDIVTKHGGQVHSIDFQYQRSTTALINKIRT